ncbi:hypothetical protein F2P81_010701 [Scophthalmus maximus]|uniref:Uncharacterized protein n=1 Tax=Scophthalmus maximus TaxID=52904 RepID=A0A6A4SWC2_SCOMX|nr:hypothetical protein F2P81_010701 [Scophthalmus maximus]
MRRERSSCSCRSAVTDAPEKKWRQPPVLHSSHNVELSALLSESGSTLQHMLLSIGYGKHRFLKTTFIECIYPSPVETVDKDG